MKSLGQLYLAELEAEAKATRHCLERIPLKDVFDWKPHEKSMQMGYLSVLVADIPRWISHLIEHGDIDFATWENAKIETTEELVAHFEKTMQGAKRALAHVSDDALHKPFSLKHNGHVLMTSQKDETISSSINHLVHHRGQLTVYMRLKDITVPSIYGPSADDKQF